MDDFKLNDSVIVIGKNTKGKIAFIGNTHVSKGKMFGVILDEPKGKYSGTIGNVTYFESPKNCATFVRSCQLQKDDKCFLVDRKSTPAYPNYLKNSSSKYGLQTIRKSASMIGICNPPTTKKKSVKPPNLHIQKTLNDEKYQKDDAATNEVGVIDKVELAQKEADCSSDDWVTSTFPNDMNDNSPIHELKTTQETTSKSEIHRLVTTKRKQVKPPKLDQPDNEKCQKVDEAINKVGKSKTNCPGNSEMEKQRLGEVLAELSVVKQNLAEGSKNMDAVHGHLRNLKHYWKWNEEIKKESNSGDHGIDNLIKLLADSPMTEMEGKVGQTEKTNFVDDGSKFRELNYFLRMYVEDLEKRYETLADSLTHAESIIKRTVNQSCSKIAYPQTFDSQVEKRSKDCLSKCQVSTDAFKHGTRHLLESVPVKNAELPKNLNKELYFSEKIKRYMESMPSHTESEVNGTMKNENVYIKDQLQIPNPDYTGIYQDLLKSFTETNVSLKHKIQMDNHKRVIRNTDQTAPQTRKLSPKMSPVKNPFEGPAKELQELISEVISRVFLINKATKNCPTEDYSAAPKETLQEQRTSMKSNSIVGCSSHSNLLQMKTLPNNSCKLETEKNFKRSSSQATSKKTLQEQKTSMKSNSIVGCASHSNILQMKTRPSTSRKLETEMNAKRSSSQATLKKTLQEQKTSMKSNSIVGCASHSNLLQMKTRSRNSRKLETEKNAMHTRSASTGRMIFK